MPLSGNLVHRQKILLRHAAGTRYGATLDAYVASAFDIQKLLDVPLPQTAFLTGFDGAV